MIFDYEKMFESLPKPMPDGAGSSLSRFATRVGGDQLFF
jgi:hypothetical protein